jgi:hypothetical protein
MIVARNPYKMVTYAWECNLFPWQGKLQAFNTLRLLNTGTSPTRGGKSQNPFWEASVSVKYFLPDCVLPAMPRPPSQLHFIAFLSDNFYKYVKVSPKYFPLISRETGKLKNIYVLKFNLHFYKNLSKNTKQKLSKNVALVFYLQL